MKNNNNKQHPITIHTSYKIILTTNSYKYFTIKNKKKEKTNKKKQTTKK
jgi:hypothetical protein